ncbi:MAG TPA: acylphosphatase [Methanoregulaceae archaeon]|nr:acylphosphatase [Methanoregulaceae archaeon]
MKKISATVTGRVQGVGYRYYVTDLAKDLGLCGYVKNNQDGTVEVVAEGEEERLNDLIERLRARGDAYIRVHDIRVEWGSASNEFRDFRIRR